MTDDVLTAAAQAVDQVEHNYLGDATPTGYAAIETRKTIRRLATRNQRPQMLHAHPHGAGCTPACLGILPGAADPDRLRRLLAALTQELNRR